MVKPGETQRLSDLVSITQLLDLNLEILASELTFIPITILCLNNSSFNGQLNSLGEEKGLSLGGVAIKIRRESVKRFGWMKPK